MFFVHPGAETRGAVSIWNEDSWHFWRSPTIQNTEVREHDCSAREGELGVTARPDQKDSKERQGRPSPPVFFRTTLPSDRADPELLNINDQAPISKGKSPIPWHFIGRSLLKWRRKLTSLYWLWKHLSWEHWEATAVSSQLQCVH